MSSPKIVHGSELVQSSAWVRSNEFTKFMRNAGPFEPKPHIAIAVSGGADSMALCLLAFAWARRRKGTVTALTVNHGLRSESLAEAKQVGIWLNKRNIPHKVLRWLGKKPTTGVQAAAREARMGLMANWCVRHSVMHLLTGHHMNDQVGTFMIRMLAGSGCDGLAGMPLVYDLMAPMGGGVRLVRPLLSLQKSRLVETLQHNSQSWIDDPSNKNQIYARSRLDSVISKLGPQELLLPRIAKISRRAGEDRIALELVCGQSLARCVEPHPAGFFHLDWDCWKNLPNALALRVLVRIISCVSVSRFGAQLSGIEKSLQLLITNFPDRAITIGGCRIIPSSRKLLICKESRAVQGPLILEPGVPIIWDGRFRVKVSRTAVIREKCTISQLGHGEINNLRKRSSELNNAIKRIPGPARPTLPAFRDLDGMLAVPHLKYSKTDKTHKFSALFWPWIGGGLHVFGTLC